MQNTIFKWLKKFDLENSKFFKFITLFLIVLLVLRLLLTIFNLYIDYIFIIDFLFYRLFMLIGFILMGKYLFTFPFIQGIREEMLILNEGPANKSEFMTYLREYHFTLIFLIYLFYMLSVFVLVNDYWTSLFLMIGSLICFMLYWVQFIVYTKEYLKRTVVIQKASPAYNHIITRSFSSVVNTIAAHKKGLLAVCVDCGKGLATLYIGAELFYKFGVIGSPEAVPPWRARLLDEQFPEDKELCGGTPWTETKAMWATHNRSMGYPHSALYAPRAVVDRVQEQLGQMADDGVGKYGKK
jgi:hypothetical protein